MCANYSYIHNFILVHEIWRLKNRVKGISMSCFKKPVSEMNLNILTTLLLTQSCRQNTSYLIRLEVLIDLKGYIGENFFKKLPFKKSGFLQNWTKLRYGPLLFWSCFGLICKVLKVVPARKGVNDWKRKYKHALIVKVALGSSQQNEPAVIYYLLK